MINSSHILESLFQKNTPLWIYGLRVSDLGLTYSLGQGQQSECEDASVDLGQWGDGSSES